MASLLRAVAFLGAVQAQLDPMQTYEVITRSFNDASSTDPTGYVANGEDVNLCKDSRALRGADGLAIDGHERRHDLCSSPSAMTTRTALGNPSRTTATPWSAMPQEEGFAKRVKSLATAQLHHHPRV